MGLIDKINERDCSYKGFHKLSEKGLNDFILGSIMWKKFGHQRIN